MPLRAFGRHAVRLGCPPPIPSRPLVPRAEAWSSRGDRQSGSSTSNRVTGALPPAGLRWPSAGAQHVGARGNGPLPGVLDLHVGCRCRRGAFGSPEASRWAKGAPGRGMPEPFMRSGRKRLARERQRKTGSHAESGQHAASPRKFGDPKRVKRHERDTRRAPAKTRSSVSDVKLGCSFFEKWVVRLKFGASRDEGAS
jgi:hypothetical protein